MLAITRPGLLLRLEGGVVFLAAIGVYGWRGDSWLLLLLLILAPDLSMIGYVANPRLGSVTYNVVHAYVLPAALATLGWLTTNPLLVTLALIWIAHIGADRLLGFGLKYPTVFKDTHLQRV